MFEFGFTQFKETIFKPSGSILSRIMVNNEPVDLILDRPIYMTQKLDKQNSVLNLRVIPNSSSSLSSVKEGQVVAKVEVLEGNTLVNTLPLKSSLTIYSPILNSNVRTNFLALIKGFMLIGVVLSLLISLKIYADRRWWRQMQIMKRRESNS